METIGGRDVATDVRAVPISVRVSFHSSLEKVTTQCLVFFLQFVFASVRLQRAASCRSVVKDSWLFVPTIISFGVQLSPQHTNNLWVVLCQRTAFVMSSLVS